MASGRGRMASVTYITSITSYSYDNAGRRVRKFSNSGAASTVLFAYDLNDHLLGEYPPSKLVGTRTPSGMVEI